MTSLELRKAIRTNHAYPMFGVTTDTRCLCMDCMRKEYRTIAWARRYNDTGGWQVVAVEVNWEDTELYCAHCEKKIEAA